MPGQRNRTLGVILGGGAGSRIGGRKPMAGLCGRPMIAHVADALRPCVGELAVVGDLQAAQMVGATSLDDPQEIPPGPMAGVLAGLLWSESRDADWLAVLACDTPLLPSAIVERLLAEAKGDVVVAETSDGLQPLVSVWRCGTSTWLSEELAAGSRAVHAILSTLDATRIRFEDAAPFMNVNTADDLASAEAVLLRRNA